MNETPDPLEAELRALVPHDVSPGLRRRIAERLAEPSSSPLKKAARIKLPRWRWLAITGAIAAACLVAVNWWWGSGDVNSRRVIVGSRDTPPVKPAPRVGLVAPQRNGDWQPRLLTYQRALARSPEELDLLLGREAAFATESPAQLVQFRAFTPSNISLNAFLGDD
jgi:hypothetical protein